MPLEDVGLLALLAAACVGAVGIAFWDWGR